MATQIDRILSDKSDWCLSIQIPLQKYGAQRSHNAGSIKRSLNDARKKLQFSAASRDSIQLLLDVLDTIENEIPKVKSAQGLGIYLSKNIKEIVLFPFKVKEGIFFDRTFEIRDLLYYRQCLSDYLVVRLSKSIVRLYHAHDTTVGEINNRHFPLVYENDYEYSRPSFGHSYGSTRKNFERDKSQLIKTRLEAFFRKADEGMSLLVNENKPFLLCGTSETTNLFKQITRNKRYLAGTIKGAVRFPFSGKVLTDFQKEITRFKRKQIQSVLSSLEEGKNGGRIVKGIESIWSAAIAAEPSTVLVVEKDFGQQAYKSQDGQIFLTPPASHYSVVQDAVDDVIESVQQRKGEIVFVGNNTLEKFHHIAMLVYDSQPVA
jgi:hypothetical protein